MNPFFATHANATSLQQPVTVSGSIAVQQAAALGVDQSMATVRQLLTELSRKQPMLDPDTKFYLVVLLCIAAANSVFTFVRAFSFAYGGLVAARKLHEQLLTAVIAAPAKFFQTTLPGKHKSMAEVCLLLHYFPRSIYHICHGIGVLE